MKDRNRNRNRTVKKGTRDKKNKTLNKDTCSPYSRGRRVVSKSCFTKGIILDLKSTYNRSQTDKTKQITSKDPIEIHKVLQERLPYCKKESCWVQNIAKDNVKTKLLSLLFAPPQPDEWRNKPNTWLTNYDILGVLRQYEYTFPQFYFIGPSAIDYDYRKQDEEMRCVCPNLCNFSLNEQYVKGKRKFGVIFNLDKHNQEGSHWVSLFIDIDERFVFYFDSTSDSIPTEINRFISTVMRQGNEMVPQIEFTRYENKKMEHQRQNNECGMYSLFFIITMLIREKDGQKLTSNDVIKLFLGKKGRIPDKDMNVLRDTYFSK
jgi:hypothetical protein|tara:strand:- start:47 stop:1003 length:957 start_codon:yes stop_codon:yes gene_type:complete